MNIFIITLVIFVLIYIFLNWFAKSSTKKLAKTIRSSVIVVSILLAILMAFAGRYIFSLPFLMMVLPLIKTKAGLTLLQFLRIWGLLRVLKNYGRFNFNNINQNYNNQSISLEEAYKILNLNPKKKYTKDQVMSSYKKIMKKIHPDISPELNRLASIVNEAKETVIKDIS
ncbi:MAG: molecular chaperone DnaJ [Candidatus Pelagibacter sp. TMED118]|nr:MAG: molecular chaperone DnaJ [Candidatus Pelagibacter sp. TMED118]|tara:strand:+ start:314 stop:823 length:510 start_codon:yes stop_codon:yes gene_type:complete